MSILRIAALAAVPLVLGSCAGTGLKEAEQKAPAGSEFERQLHANYLDLSRSEFDEHDYRDSDEFAGRALAAASGAAREPEPLVERDLPRDKAGELAEARSALLASFANGSREANPAAAARAQVMFECWMQEQEENFQPKEIAACRNGFYSALVELEKRPEPVAEQLESTGKALVYGINYDFDSARLRPEATPVLEEILAALEAKPGMNLQIEGHTDAIGTDQYNDGLSQRRAASVVNWLVTNGISAERLEARGMGETQPVADNATPTGRAENRRVELQTWTN